MHLVVSLLLIESYYFLNLTPMPFIPLREVDSGRGRILNIKFKVKDKL